MTTALARKQTPLSVILGVRDLSERRDKLQAMYAALQNIGRGIIGDGFAIIQRDDPRCGEYFEVYRRGFGWERVKSLTRVASMFTPDMFIDGIIASDDACPALPGTPRCAKP